VIHPFWPICCERLAVLLSCNGGGVTLADVETQTGPLDLAYLEAEIENSWSPRSPQELDKFLHEGFRAQLEEVRRGKGEGGLNIFRCSSCERVYVASCEG
jgi:deoxyxylulose-5-phosphate synthase